VRARFTSTRASAFKPAKASATWSSRQWIFRTVRGSCSFAVDFFSTPAPPAAAQPAGREAAAARPEAQRERVTGRRTQHNDVRAADAHGGGALAHSLECVLHLEEVAVRAAAKRELRRRHCREGVCQSRSRRSERRSRQREARLFT